jgi:hypothetical protein
MTATKPRFYKILLSLAPLLPNWRGVNIAVFVVALFAPWFPGFAQIGSIGNAEPFNYPVWFILTFLILRPPALIGLLVYLILSLYKLINPSSWSRYLLFILAGMNFLSFVWLTWFFFNGDLLWGYWLLCAGGLSSLILETIELYFFVARSAS